MAVAELSVRPDLARHIIPPQAEQAIYDEYKINLGMFDPVDLAKYRVQVE